MNSTKLTQFHVNFATNEKNTVLNLFILMFVRFFVCLFEFLVLVVKITTKNYNFLCFLFNNEKAKRKKKWNLNFHSLLFWLINIKCWAVHCTVRVSKLRSGNKYSWKNTSCSENQQIRICIWILPCNPYSPKPVPLRCCWYSLKKGGI